MNSKILNFTERLRLVFYLLKGYNKSNKELNGS